MASPDKIPSAVEEVMRLSGQLASAETDLERLLRAVEQHAAGKRVSPRAVAQEIRRRRG